MKEYHKMNALLFRSIIILAIPSLILKNPLNWLYILLEIWTQSLNSNKKKLTCRSMQRRHLSEKHVPFLAPTQSMHTHFKIQTHFKKISKIIPILFWKRNVLNRGRGESFPVSHFHHSSLSTDRDTKEVRK